MSWRREIAGLMAEYRRPWKLASLTIGIGLLIVGSFFYQAPDWDIPVSFIMAILAYMTASWSIHVLLERQWRRIPLMLILAWFTVDGCYCLYWRFKAPAVLDLMREANFPASLCLFAACGLVWYYKGSLRQFLDEAREFIAGAGRTGA